MKARSFDERYASVPVELRETLLQFRRTHPYTEADAGGTAWEYISSGKGKQALLILGGGISTGETSFRSILRLEDRFRLISPSYPAVGNMEMIANGLVDIIRKEGFEHAHVWGHSLGSAVAHAFIRVKPECVDKMVLDGFGLYTSHHTRAVKYFFKLPYFLLVAYYRRVLQRLIQDGADSETRFYNIYLQEILTSKRNKNSFIGQFKLLVDIFDHPEKYRIFQPVKSPGEIQLVLANDDRGFTAEERQALIDSYPEARVHTFEAGGHLSGFTHRAEFDRVLDEFLDS